MRRFPYRRSPARGRSLRPTTTSTSNTVALASAGIALAIPPVDPIGRRNPPPTGVTDTGDALSVTSPGLRLTVYPKTGRPANGHAVPPVSPMNALRLPVDGSTPAPRVSGPLLPELSPAFVNGARNVGLDDWFANGGGENGASGATVPTSDSETGTVRAVWRQETARRAWAAGPRAADGSGPGPERREEETTSATENHVRQSSTPVFTPE